MNVCMVAYTFYEFAARVRRYAEALAKRGDHVDVLALKTRGQARYECINGVHLHRIQSREINEKTKASYLARLLLFLVNSTAVLSWFHLQKRYKAVHVHSVPDFEVFAAWLPKLTGARLILDIHDLVPEFYSMKFRVSRSSVVYKMLLFVERFSAWFADHVIIANDIWRERLVQRSVPAHKCTALLNFPDTSIFRRRGRSRTDSKFIMLYPGTINHHNGLDIALRAMTRIKEIVPELEFHIYGMGPAKDEIVALIDELKLGPQVHLHGMVPADKLAAIVENADLGVVPKRANLFSDEAFSTKILEFMALGIPVLCSKTTIDQFYFNDSLVEFFEPENDADLARAILSVIRHPEIGRRRVENATRFIAKNNWDVKKTIYFDLLQGKRADMSKAHGPVKVASNS